MLHFCRKKHLCRAFTLQYLTSFHKNDVGGIILTWSQLRQETKRRQLSSIAHMPVRFFFKPGEITSLNYMSGKNDARGRHLLLVESPADFTFWSHLCFKPENVNTVSTEDLYQCITPELFPLHFYVDKAQQPYLDCLWKCLSHLIQENETFSCNIMNIKQKKG